MNPQPQQLVKVVITHSTGTKFKVVLSKQELETVQSDPDYADQVAEKYYGLYLSGHVTAVEAEASDTFRRDEAGAILAHPSGSAEPVQPERRPFCDEDEEILIRLVSERPALYDFRLPLKDRARSKVRNLWLDVIQELDVDITVDAIAKKWKNMRDSFMRVRANIKKKISSGSSAEEKLQAERLKRSHRNYELLMFLEDSLTCRRTSTNLEGEESDGLMSPLLRNPTTPSGSRSRLASSTGSTSTNKTDTSTVQDEVFIEAVKNLAPGANRELSPTQNFCSGKTPYTQSERLLLTSLVDKYKNIIENKRKDAHTVQEKQKAWEKVASEYNAQASMISAKRTSAQLKKLWNNLKQSKAQRFSITPRDHSIQYLESHPTFAAGKFAGKGGKDRLRHMWDILAGELNAIVGGASKDSSQWQTMLAEATMKHAEAASDQAKDASAQANAALLQAANEREPGAAQRNFAPGDTLRHDHKAQRYSIAQKDHSIQYLESHPMFATAKFAGKGGKERLRHMWDILAGELNAIVGGASKDSSQWQTMLAEATMKHGEASSDQAKDASAQANAALLQAANGRQKEILKKENLSKTLLRKKNV
ncbi:unnamed protein product [Ceutorhynchus assimilis]|uniref:Regulatory protein zeste n=1 Tax=Ceutorhynchus assimilis TaxID=467358 RepID=A0A9N9QRC2_9CUCU|nr:unnamed protein product [Ceutorhynchus assimilis]